MAYAFAHQSTPSAAASLRMYHAYVELPLHMMLGFGMVVMQMEDAKREVDDARTELAVSNDRLQRMAMYDTLTECLNRRAYAEGIGLEFAKSTFGTTVMLDMDNLKVINDGYGHAMPLVSTDLATAPLASPLVDLSISTLSSFCMQLQTGAF